MEPHRQMRQTGPRALRFVLIPKVAHPWFTEVHRGAELQARFLQEQSGTPITVELLPPPTANVHEQDSLLARVTAEAPSGIAIDPVGSIRTLPAMSAARERGVPVVVFDSPPSDRAFPSIGNDFAEQGALAAQRLVRLVGEVGEVAIMQGVPTAPNHAQRYEAERSVLRQYPQITMIDGGIDNDDIPTARREAAAVLTSRPDLSGYLCCDASGPIGIADAIRDAGKVGRVHAVGIDGIEPILREIEEGVLDSSVATIPDVQGSMALLMLWQASHGMRIPERIDTGMEIITSENVHEYLAASRS